MKSQPIARFAAISAISIAAMLSPASAAEGNSLAGAKAAFTQFLKFNNAHQMSSPAAKKLLTGEATSFAKYPDVGRISGAEKVQLTPQGAAFHVQQLDEKGVAIADAYFYAKREKGVWKISAARSFALTGLIGMARDELQKKPRLSASEKLELLNMNLTLASDKTLKTYFLKHRADFEKLRIEAARPNPQKMKRARELGLTDARKNENGEIDCVIGGISDNTVGFLYVPQNRQPPISDEDKIWVERCAPGWFFYRTT